MLRNNICKLILPTVLISAGCAPREIKVEVDAGNTNQGVFTLADADRKMIDAKNLAGGKASFTFNALEPGYYFIQLADGKSNLMYNEVYLEGGNYAIRYSGKDAAEYPSIKTASPMQDELNIFYQAKQKGSTNVQALQKLASQKEQSKTALHLMQDMDLTDQPGIFKKVLGSLSAEDRNSKRGKYIASQLQAIETILPGKKAPALTGVMPDGSPFNFTPKKSTRYIILAFWKSANWVSREDSKILARIHHDYGNRGVEVISVSSDSKPDWWKKAVKDDHMQWLNVSDLKGSESANLARYHITTIPTYMLLKGDLSIVDNDASVKALPGIINQSLD